MYLSIKVSLLMIELPKKHVCRAFTILLSTYYA